MLKRPSEQHAAAEPAFSDPLIPLARQLILEHRDASISFLQRHLRIGFTRAKGLHAALEGTVVTIPGADGSRQIIETQACTGMVDGTMGFLQATTTAPAEWVNDA